MADLTVANTILQQLGGVLFRRMTGAKDFVGSADSLAFALPARFARKGINRVKVTLTPFDVYDVEFGRVSGKHPYKLIAERRGVYVGELRETFTSETGLETSLGKAAE